MKNDMKHGKRTLWAIMIAAIAVPFAAYFIPLPPSDLATPPQLHATMAFTSIFMWLHVGAAILFIVGLKNFKTRLRQAYAFICGGLVLIGASLLVNPLFTAFSVWNKPLGAFGQLPYVPAILLVFIGARRFARAINVKDWWTSLSFVSGLAIMSLAIGWLSQPYDAKLAISTVCCIVSIAATLVVLRIKQFASPAYGNALAWFFVSLATNTVAFVCIVVFQIMADTGGPWLLVPFILASAFFVKAGYAFNKIGEY